MIGIKVNDQFLDLPDNFKVVLTRKSPLYFSGNMDEVPGSYSLPTNIKVNDVNRKAIKQHEFLNNWNEETRIDAELWLNYNFYEHGHLYITQSNSREYRIQFISRAGILADMKEKLLRDYQLGVVTIEGNWLTDGLQMLNDYEIATQTEADHPHVVFPMYIQDRDDERTEFRIICPKFLPVLKNIFEKEFYDFETDMDNYPEFEDLLLWFKRAHNAPLIFLNDTLPQIPVLNLLKGINKLFCMGFDIDTRTKKVRQFIMRDLIKRTDFVDYSSRLTSDFTKKEKTYSVKSFSYATDPTKDLLNEDYHDLNELPPVQTIEDLPTTADEDDICFVFKEQKYYQMGRTEWKITDEDDNDLGKVPLNSLTIGEEGSEIQSSLGPLYIEHFEHIRASTSQYINYTSTQWLEEPTEEAFLLWWRGRLPTHEGEQPYPTPFSFDHLGNEVGNYSLQWHGTKGLYETWWKPWLDFINSTIPIEVSMRWEWQDLWTFDFLRPIKLWDGYSGGYHRFFVQEQKISVSMKGIEKATQKLIQIRN